MDHVTVAEAAKLLGVSTDTVQRRVASGELPAERVTARLYLIPRAALESAQRGPKKAGRKRRDGTS